MVLVTFFKDWKSKLKFDVTTDENKYYLSPPKVDTNSQQKVLLIMEGWLSKMNGTDSKASPISLPNCARIRIKKRINL